MLLKLKSILKLIIEIKLIEIVMFSKIIKFINKNKRNINLIKIFYLIIELNYLVLNLEFNYNYSKILSS